MIPHSKPLITAEDRHSVDQALVSGMIATGARVRAFEHAVASSCGAIDGVATSSGTVAITLALMGLRLPRGSEVIIPTYVCRQVMMAVISADLTPVLCDVGVDGLVNVDTISARRTQHTRAIIVVHLFGRVVTMPPILAMGIPVIEDACQAFGIGLGPRGGRGIATVFSFQATKAVTTGEGGMVVANDIEFVSVMRRLRDGGRDLNRCVLGPMSDISAALGGSQLARYPKTLARRRWIAERYAWKLAGCPVIIDSVENLRLGYAFRFVLRSAEGFEAAESSFAEAGVTVRRGVDSLLHRELNKPGYLFPISERLFRETVSVPLYPALSDNEVDLITALLPRVFPASA